MITLKFDRRFMREDTANKIVKGKSIIIQI